MIFGLGLEKAGTNPPVMKHALDLGIRFFDTAPTYSQGTNESFFGQVLKESNVPREEITISTKTHLRSHDEALMLLDRSLKQLQTNYIDIWSLHDLSTIHDLRVLTALVEAKNSGKVKKIGITCNRDPIVLRKAIEKYPFDYVMMTLNVADKHYASFITEVLPYVNREKTKIIAMQVFMRGRSLYHAIPYFDSLCPTTDHPMCPKCPITQLGLTAHDTKPVTASWICPSCGYMIDTQAIDIFNLYQNCINYVASYNPDVMLIGCNNIRQLDIDWIAFNNRQQITEQQKMKLEDQAKPYGMQLNFFKTPLKKEFV